MDFTTPENLTKFSPIKCNLFSPLTNKFPLEELQRPSRDRTCGMCYSKSAPFSSNLLTLRSRSRLSSRYEGMPNKSRGGEMALPFSLPDDAAAFARTRLPDCDRQYITNHASFVIPQTVVDVRCLKNRTICFLDFGGLSA